MAVVEEMLSRTNAIEEWPQHPLSRFIFRAPLYLWRLGWRFLLPSNFACITTRGRKSALPRHTMVEHARLDGQFYIVSGWQEKPHWVQNLLTDPHITIQPAHGEAVAGTAQRILEDATLQQVFTLMQESPMWEAWLESQGIQPGIDNILAKKKQVYVFQITPAGEIDLPALAEDLRWMPWLALGVAALFLVLRLSRRQEQGAAAETER